MSSVVLQQTLRDQDRAFNNFFGSCTGTRRGPKMRYPRFKTRNSRKSLRFTKQGFTHTNGEIRLAKMMDEPLGIVWSRPLPEGVAPSSVTVSQDAAGRWFISILCEEIITPLAKTKKTVGVDLGVKTFALYSDGQHIEHPKLLAKKAARLARYQRVASRRKPKPGKEASRNYVKAKIRVAKQHVKVADARRDFLHTTTTDLVTRFDVVVIEDLHVAGMKRNRHLAKAISDSGWGEFRTLIEYKTQWYGKRLIVIDRWHPSSKLCSTPGCDGKNNHLKLSERSWTCLECGTLHDRDFNAVKWLQAHPRFHMHFRPTLLQLDQPSRTILRLHHRRPARPQRLPLRPGSRENRATSSTNYRRSTLAGTLPRRPDDGLRKGRSPHRPLDLLTGRGRSDLPSRGTHRSSRIDPDAVQRRSAASRGARRVPPIHVFHMCRSSPPRRMRGQPDPPNGSPRAQSDGIPP